MLPPLPWLNRSNAFFIYHTENTAISDKVALSN